jgi:uncharacterized membrane protein
VGYSKFDEGSGTAASDSSGNNNTGTLVNGPVWTAGQAGNALSFDGVNDYVQVNANTIFNLSKPFTVAFWFKNIQTGNLVILENNQNSGYSVQRESDNTMNITVNSVNHIGTSKTYHDGLWHHIVFVVQGSGTVRIKNLTLPLKRIL